MIISLIQLLHLKIVEECLLYAGGWVKHLGSSYLILIASQFCNLLVFVSSVQLEAGSEAGRSQVICPGSLSQKVEEQEFESSYVWH